MNGLTLEQAARESARSARELRIAIESGDLPGVQRRGRWLIDPVDLRQLVMPEPLSDPAPPRLTEVPPPATASDALGRHPLDELLARLETRAVEVAMLREQLSSHRDAEGEKVDRLERELSATRMELERTRRRRDERAYDERLPSPRHPGMRDALTPLFERSRAPGGSGSARD